jgi:hypothetical protein
MKKTIKIGDEEFMYEILHYTNEFDSYEKTVFFKEYEVKWKKKYFLFGKKTKSKKPIILFSINYSVETPFITKEIMGVIIKKASESYFREKEVKKGKII